MVSRGPALTIVLAGMALLGWWLTQDRSLPVPARSEGTSTVIAQVGLTAKGSPRTAEEADSPLAILRKASRGELLAYGRDLLAHGAQFEKVVTLLEFLVNDRPELAVELARGIGRTDAERQVFLYATLSAWASKDPATALHWACDRSGAYDIPGQASLLYVTLEEIAADKPSAAVAAAASILRSDRVAPTAAPARDVARFALEALIKTGHLDVAKSALESWACGPEAKRLGAADFGIVAMALAGQSFQQASAWLQSLATSPARNESLRPFATAWSDQDPAAAMAWSEQLNPADGGDDVRVAVFARWLKSDRPTASRWLAAQSVSDPTRGRLLVLVDSAN